MFAIVLAVIGVVSAVVAIIVALIQHGKALNWKDRYDKESTYLGDLRFKYGQLQDRIEDQMMEITELKDQIVVKDTNIANMVNTITDLTALNEKSKPATEVQTVTAGKAKKAVKGKPGPKPKSKK